MVVFLIITWVLSGILALFIACGIDMRNEEYDENYFDGCAMRVLIVICNGYISLIVALYVLFENRHIFTRLIYTIVNIGIKDKNKNR